MFLFSQMHIPYFFGQVVCHDIPKCLLLISQIYQFGITYKYAWGQINFFFQMQRSYSQAFMNATFVRAQPHIPVKGFG